MLRWIIGGSLQSRILILAAAIALVVLGTGRLPGMSADVLPEFMPPIVEVQTEALGLSASEVESLITVNLEELLSGVPWVSKVTSQSVSGLSSIRLWVEPGADIMRVRQMVQERLTLAYTLPNVSKPPVMLQPLSAANRVIMVGMSSKSVSLIQQSVLAQWTIKPKLLAVPGVANVAVWGERRRQLQVQMDQDQLRTQGIKQEQIISTSGDSLWVSFLSFLKSSVPGSGGWIDAPQQRLEIRHVLPLSSAQDLARVAVDGSTTLRLGDVGKIVENHPLLIGDAVVGDGPGLLLVVEKFPWANTLEVTRGAEAAIAALKTGMPGIEIDSTIFRPASFIEAAAGNLSAVVLASAALVLLALLLLLRDWRSALVAAIAIPLAMLTALFVMYARGVPVNAMVLVGLALGLAVVIDDVVTGVHSILNRLQKMRTSAAAPVNLPQAVLEATFDVRRPLLYATLIIALLLLPVAFFSGVLHALLKPVALSYLLAVLTSMTVAMVVVPALAATVMGGAASYTPAPPASGRRLGQVYDRMLAWAQAAPRETMLATAVAGLIAVGIGQMLHTAPIPELKERNVVVNWTTAPGTSHAEALRLSTLISRELRTVSGIANVAGHVGRAVTGDQVVGMNSGQIWIAMDPKADHEPTMTAIQDVATGYPGVSVQVQTYTAALLTETISRGSNKPVVVRVFGPDAVVLRDRAVDIKRSLANIYGLVDLQVVGEAEEPLIDVKVDLANAAKHGLKPGDVRRAASTVFAGIEAGRIFEQQKIFEVVVWSTPESRNGLTSVNDLLIETPSGGAVRLSEVAEVSIKPTRAIIKREAISNYLEVVADVQGRDVPSALREVARRLQDTKLPLGYHAEAAGAYSESLESRLRVLAVSACALIGIYLLLQAAFASWALSAAVMIAIPAALSGAALAALIDGGAVSIGGMAGFVAVFAFLVRQIVLLVASHRDHERDVVPAGESPVARTMGRRMLPTLTSALAIVAALVPLLVAGDIAGLELLRQMALITIGGVITSAAVVLLVLPVLLQRFGSRSPADADIGVAHHA